MTLGRELLPLVADLVTGTKAPRFLPMAALLNHHYREVREITFVEELLIRLSSTVILFSAAAAIIGRAQDCPSCSAPAGVVEGRVIDLRDRAAAGVTVYAEKVNFESGVFPT